MLTGLGHEIELKYLDQNNQLKVEIRSSTGSLILKFASLMRCRHCHFPRDLCENGKMTFLDIY